MARVRDLGEEQLAWIMDSEREFAAYDPERGLAYLKEELIPLVEAPTGWRQTARSRFAIMSRSIPTTKAARSR